MEKDTVVAEREAAAMAERITPVAVRDDRAVNSTRKIDFPGDTHQ